MFRTFFSGLLCLSILSLFGATGCSSIPARQGSYWHGDWMTGSPSIKISLKEQKAYFYKGNRLAGVSLISTGREGLKTVTGNFTIIEKDKDHCSSLFGDYVAADGKVLEKNINTAHSSMPPGAHYDGAAMPYFMRIFRGTGMHEGFLPGYPASHGCIRMPRFMAMAFYKSVSVGTPVVIQP